MEHTMSDVLRVTTEGYLFDLDRDNPPSPARIESDLLSEIRAVINAQNGMLEDGERKWKSPQMLGFQQIAEIVAYLYPVYRIATAGTNADTTYDLLAIYQSEGPDEGIYVTSDEVFRNLARSYNYQLTTREFNEFMTALRDMVPRKECCHEPNLIAVNNGIFDFDTKQLLPFTPDLVFMAKSRINYNPNAQNITIHNPDDNTDWDVESWMHSLSDDPDIVNVLWEVLGAIVRPNVPWNKSAWFYSETGNNGKGTLCELMRQLCGDGSFASIPLSDMGKDFMLEPLTRATAIIVDENDVGTYIDKAANLKAIITNDAISINRKFKQAISYRFYGFMVQCLNEMPRIKDKSDSFFRRQLFIPFDKCFTGAERKYIKHDYLHRIEVLEYVLYRVLHMTNYTLSEPAACKAALEEYKEYNDPVRQFIEEIIPLLSWDLVPYKFVFDLYVAWSKKNFTNSNPLGRNVFLKTFKALMKDNPDWICKTQNTNGKVKDTNIRPCNRMDEPEHLIDDYQLMDWMNPLYRGSLDWEKRCKPPLKSEYTGMLRAVPRTQVCENESECEYGYA